MQILYKTTAMKRIFKYILIQFTLLYFIDPLLGQSKVEQQTYKVGRTEYFVGQSYKTTGNPLVKRSSLAKDEFLKSLGLNSIPHGYQIDHIQPLSQGGEDTPENMQLLTIGQHNLKTAIERGEVAELDHWNITLSSFTHYDKPIGVRNIVEWENQKDYSPEEIDKELNSKRVVYTGAKGGRYYYSVNGKKSYLKSEKFKSSPITVVNSPLQPASSNVQERKTYSEKQQIISQSSIINSSSYKSSDVKSNSSVPVQPSYDDKGHEIITGPRGGHYYINSNGNKTYIKRN